jgi:hypothetical protein
MLSKCANPACLARFHYLHEGRIFKIETATVLSDGHKSPNHRIEHFWLCERCAQTLSVVVENGVVTTRPLRLQLAKSVSEDNPGRKRAAA